MGIVFGLIAAAIGIAVTLAAAAEQRRARALSWRRAAQRAGLSEIQDEPGGLFRSGWLHGRSGPLEVRLEKRRDGSKDHGEAAGAALDELAAPARRGEAPWS